MSGRTPGPWGPIEYDNDTGADDGGFWEWYSAGPIRVDVERGKDAEAKANITLASAAPNLYAALVAMLDEDDGGRAADMARAAIAKADGGME